MDDGAMSNESLINEYAVSTVRCSGPNCDHVRQAVNHWFVVKLGVADRTTLAQGFICYPYKAHSELAHFEFPVCGQNCAQRKFEHWLTTGKF